MKTASISILLLVAFGCAKVEHAHNPALVGTWEPYYMTIEDANSDTSQPMPNLFMATPDNWEKVTGIKPIRITYSSDGTFTREHRDKNDSIFLRSSGTWYTVGDTLHWFQDRPDTFRLTLQYTIAMDTVRMRGIVDFDRDGNVNDAYTEFLKKIAPVDSTM